MYATPGASVHGQLATTCDATCHRAVARPLVIVLYMLCMHADLPGMSLYHANASCIAVRRPAACAYYCLEPLLISYY